MLSESRFNDATGLLLRGGAMLGADASGVSGQPGDKALSLDKSTSPGAFAVPGGTAAPAEGYTELTVTAWYKPRADLADADTLWNAFGSQMLWDGKLSEWMLRVGSKSPSNPNAKAWYASGKTPPPITAGQWTFIAVTWKQTENRADYYMGSKETPAAFTKKVQRNDPLEPAKEGKARSIGNDPSKPERAFSGEIDNVRFFSKALDAATIEKIRAADAKNEAVTLP